MQNHRDLAIAASRGILSHMASPLIAQMGITKATNTPVALLDSACGSGVVTQEVHKVLARDILDRSSVLCADVTPGMTEIAKWRVESEPWANTEARTLDAMNTKLPDNSFTHVAVSMGFHIIPDPDAVLRDCKRILRTGGVLGLSTPHQAAVFWEPDVRSAFASLPFPAPIPKTIPKQMHDQGNWVDPEWIDNHLRSMGFSDVKVTTLRRVHRVQSAEDFVATFGPMIAHFLTKWWDENMLRAHPAPKVTELIRKHLAEKHGGQGWDLEWHIIYSTCRWEK